MPTLYGSATLMTTIRIELSTTTMYKQLHTHTMTKQICNIATTEAK